MIKHELLYGGFICSYHLRRRPLLFAHISALNGDSNSPPPPQLHCQQIRRLYYILCTRVYVIIRFSTWKHLNQFYHEATHVATYMALTIFRYHFVECTPTSGQCLWSHSLDAVLAGFKAIMKLCYYRDTRSIKMTSEWKNWLGLSDQTIR